MGSLFGVITLFFNLFTLTYQGKEFMLLKGSMVNSAGEVQFFAWYFTPVLITTCLYGFLTIFRYANLQRQLAAVRTNIILSILSIAGMVAFVIHATTKLGNIVEFDFSPFVFGPVLMLAFNYLAFKSVKKDLDLIKSVDRIR